MPGATGLITPELAEVISEAIDSALLDVHTSIPASIVIYNPATQTATVQIDLTKILEKLDGSLTIEPFTLLQNVPCSILGSTGHVIAFALAPGDTGHMCFSEASIDQWRTKGVLTSPGDIERHGMTGYFHPDWRTISKVLTDALVTGAVFGAVGGVQLRSNTTAMEVTSGGLPASIGGFVAMATKVAAELSSIATAFSSHTHAGVTTGVGTSGTPAVPPYVPGAVASTNLKAD
jgi:hypothetical protein